MKKFFMPVLLMLSLQTFALTNAEVRNAIEAEVLSSMVLPMQVDQYTKMTDVYVSTRGIVYEYDLSTDQDALGDISAVLTNIKNNIANMYCNGGDMAFYKSNNIDAFYIYYDVSGNLVGLFRISAYDC